MNYSNYRISLDIHNNASQVLIKFNKYDTARRIAFVLTEDGNPYRLSDDITCIFVAHKPDGTDIIDNCEIDAENGVILYDISAQLTTSIGLMECQLTVSNGDIIISSPRLTVQVRDIVASDIDLSSTSEFNALITAYNGVNDYLDRLQDVENVAEDMSDIIGAFNEGELKGDTGATGNGISSITKTGTSGNVDTYTITMTNGATTTFTVTNGTNGLKGDKGDSFSIYKTYASVSAMNSDSANVPEGKMVVIASNVDDPDNAKLYVKTSEGFSLITDLSGSQGIKGDTGAGITNIEKTNTIGNKDYYTITYGDNSSFVFTVTNGTEGGGTGSLELVTIGNTSDEDSDTALVMDADGRIQVLSCDFLARTWDEYKNLSSFGGIFIPPLVKGSDANHPVGYVYNTDFPGAYLILGDNGVGIDICSVIRFNNFWKTDADVYAECTFHHFASTLDFVQGEEFIFGITNATSVTESPSSAPSVALRIRPEAQYRFSIFAAANTIPGYGNPDLGGIYASPPLASNWTDYLNDDGEITFYIRMNKGGTAGKTEFGIKGTNVKTEYTLASQDYYNMIQVGCGTGGMRSCILKSFKMYKEA